MRLLHGPNVTIPRLLVGAALAGAVLFGGCGRKYESPASPEPAGTRFPILADECRDPAVKRICTEMEGIGFSILDFGGQRVTQPRIDALPDGRLRYSVTLQNVISAPDSVIDEHINSFKNYHKWSMLPSDDPAVLRFRGSRSRGTVYIATIKVTPTTIPGYPGTRSLIEAVVETESPVVKDSATPT